MAEAPAATRPLSYYLMAEDVIGLLDQLKISKVTSSAGATAASSGSTSR